MNSPFIFVASAESGSGVKSHWQLESAGHNTTCAVPTEFNGPGGALSPEDLYVQALTSCLIGTFKVYAENSKLNFEKMIVSSELTVDKNDSKKLWMKSCKLKVQIYSPSSKEKAELLIKKAFESGFIINSVKTEMSLETQIF